MTKLLSFAPLALLVAVGCKDPAKDADKAKVTSAEPLAAAPAAKGETVAIDATASKVGFVGSKVTGSHEGSFKKIDGTIELVDGKPEASSVKVVIDLDSVETDDAKLTGHLKSPDFFDVAKHPKATFTSTKIVPGGDKGASHTITGNLDLHGVTKSITFPATITVAPESVTANAEFSIDRNDFGIVYKGMPDNLIRPDVLMKLSIKGARTKS
jgi:polyisoprenoid-binding protein YceI